MFGLLVVAVPVTRPDASRTTVFCSPKIFGLEVVAIPVTRPDASRIFVCCSPSIFGLLVVAVPDGTCAVSDVASATNVMPIVLSVFMIYAVWEMAQCHDVVEKSDGV
jgi:hypothetical protein